MPKADFIAKLRQIEELANAVVAELAPGVSHTRVQHIVVLVKTLRGRLEFGSVALISAQPDGRAPDEQAPV
jgi:hypothetical protein